MRNTNALVSRKMENELRVGKTNTSDEAKKAADISSRLTLGVVEM